jgi:hypothetical protein
MKLSANFQPNLMIHGDMNIVIIVIAPTIGSRKELVTPTSAPPIATTSATHHLKKTNQLAWAG